MKKILVPGLTFIGCTLLLMGNTLPWPCSPGVWYSILCDASLDVYFVDELLVAIFIGGMTLLLLLEITLLEPPMSYVAWASYWIILYFLLVAKIRTDSTFPSFHYTWVHFTTNLVTFAVTPLSLVSYWLALRPKNLRQKYRTLSRISLLAVMLITTFLLIFAALALDLSLRYSFLVEAAIKSAPLVILAGGALLLAADYAETQPDRAESLVDDTDEDTELETVEANGG